MQFYQNDRRIKLTKLISHEHEKQALIQLILMILLENKSLPFLKKCISNHAVDREACVLFVI